MIYKSDFVEKKIIMFFTQKGDKLSFKNDNIIIYDENGKVKLQYTCYKIFALYIIGGFNITTGLIERSKKFGFSILFFTINFKLYASINYYMEGNTLLRKKQYNNANSLEIAKQIIINKVQTEKYILTKTRDKENKIGIDILNLNIEKLRLNDYSLAEIMGLEGTSAKVYFNRLFKDCEWNGRQPRVKRDKINLLLDIGYTILFNYIESILNLYGFDIYKGNLHQEFYKRKSLVCDIIEPFRFIIDYKIRKSYNLNQMNYNYTIRNGQYSLEWKDTANYINLILEEIMIYKADIFEFIQNYYRWIMKEKDIKDFPKVILK